MTLLAVDRGNTFTKLGIFSQSILQEAVSLSDAQLKAELHRLMEKHHPTDVIISSVRNDDFDLKKIGGDGLNVLVPNSDSKFPFKIDYQNKQTIGFDRLANACGAVKRFSKKNVLVVDCGTCTTYTLVQDNTLLGGAIAPGITMRLKALNHFTGRLPLLERKNELPEVPGQSTEGSIRAGAELAAILETDALIERFGNKTADLIVLLTGGGMSFFEQHLKSPTFAAPYLTLEGLHEIFLLNK